MERGARSANAQLEAMRKRWPDFGGERLADGTLIWRGPLRPKAQLYMVGIGWRQDLLLPHVLVLEPRIKPRPGTQHEDIPHLIFCDDDPPNSALCLFDPDGKEWSPADLIADTTVLWTAEWLAYYELWHLTGEWLGPGVGPESVGAMRASEARHMVNAITDVH